MLVLYDPSTLLHRTIEILGAKLIPALESPERIKVIIEAFSKSHHELRKIDFHTSTQSSKDTLKDLLKQSHDHGYEFQGTNLEQNFPIALIGIHHSQLNCHLSGYS